MRSSAPRSRSWRELRGFVAAAGFALAAVAVAVVAFAWNPPPEGPTGPLAPAARPALGKDRVFPVPFEPGETLVYGIAWLKIEGGEMTLAASRESAPDGVALHRIVLTAESNDYVSKFYPVRTRYETWVDVRDFQPVRFEKHAREGRYESDEVEEFDLSRRVGSWREARTPLPERVQDIISSFYYLRTQSLVVGQAVQLDMFSRGKIYKLSALVLGKEKVETDLGVFDAFKVQPQLRENETAEDRNRGKLFLWFSDDSRRVPVMARTILPIGSVTARLKRTSPALAPPPPPSSHAPPQVPAAAPPAR